MNNKVLSYILAGGIGGTIGWLVGDLIVYKLMEQDVVADDEDNETPVEVENKKESKIKVEKLVPNNYAAYSKGDLTTLASPYHGEGLPNSFKPAIRIIANPEELESYLESGEYDTLEVSYYAKDATFSAEEEVLEDPDKYFGVPNIHLHFGEGTDDPDMVYVVNENSKTIIEVVQIDGSYKVLVLGEDEEKKPRRRKKKDDIEQA